MKEIYVFGSLVMDHTTTTTIMPKDGETVMGESFNISYGGKGINQAHMIHKLGCNVTMIGAIGNDNNGSMFLSMMNDEKMDTSKIFKKNTSTGVSNIILDSSGQNRIIVVPGANNYLTIKDIKSIEDDIKENQIFLLVNEIPVDVIKYVINLGVNKKATIVLNPAPYKDIDIETLNKVTYLTPNESEAMELLHVKSYNEEKILKAFDKLETKNLILTLGDKGSLYYDHHNIIKNEPFKVKVVDTVGAGDAFNGGLVYGLANNLSITDSLLYANACGALAIGKKGALVAQPTLLEVKEFLKDNK